MKSLWEIREGDEVIIQTHSGAYFTTVTKVTMNQIHTHSFRYYVSNGLPATRVSIGKICQDEALWKRMTEEREQKKREREEHEKLVAARNARPTYKLACQIVDVVEPSKSIAILEGLGEAKLRKILSWLEGRA